MHPDPNTLPTELRNAADAASYPGMARVWEALDSVTPEELPVPTAEQAWEQLLARIRSDDAVPPPRPAVPPRSRTLSVRRLRWHGHTLSVRGTLAASFVVLLLAAGSWWWQQPFAVSTEAGHQQVVHLPDGSTADLNSESTLRYQRGFAVLPFRKARTRTVKLEGEAFFDVVPDASRPFVVETHDARVEVLGTRFNVRAREAMGGARTLVTLAEGRVRVHAGRVTGSPALLDVPGDVVLVDSAGVRPARTARSLEHVLAWRNKGFAALDEPVVDILQEVRRRYAIHLELRGEFTAPDPMTVFYLRGTSPEQIIHDICLARGWHYRRTSRGFAIETRAQQSVSTGRTRR